MMRYCGSEAQVRYRVDRIIDERTGRMRELSSTVTLQSAPPCQSKMEECPCEGQFGDCPRGELIFWREIWLERTDTPRSEFVHPDQKCNSVGKGQVVTNALLAVAQAAKQSRSE